MNGITRKSEIILYQTEDGKTKLEVRLEQESIWLTQAAMAELFQTTPQNITLHLKEIYNTGELSLVATCKENLQVQKVKRKTIPAPGQILWLYQSALFFLG